VTHIKAATGRELILAVTIDTGDTVRKRISEFMIDAAGADLVPRLPQAGVRGDPGAQ
jgi:hypothetical protein